MTKTRAVVNIVLAVLLLGACGGKKDVKPVTEESKLAREAFALADRVAILRAGRIVQVGTPEEVYCHPADAFVARFLGIPNLIEGRVHEGGWVETEIGRLTVPAAQGVAVGTQVTVLVRPEAATLATEEEAPHAVRGQVIERSFRGGHYQVRVACNGQTLALEVRPLGRPLPAPGEEIALTLRPAGLSLLSDGFASSDPP